MCGRLTVDVRKNAENYINKQNWFKMGPKKSGCGSAGC